MTALGQLHTRMKWFTTEYNCLDAEENVHRRRHLETKNHINVKRNFKTRSKNLKHANILFLISDVNKSGLLAVYNNSIGIA